MHRISLGIRAAHAQSNLFVDMNVLEIDTYKRSHQDLDTHFIQCQKPPRSNKRERQACLTVFDFTGRGIVPQDTNY